MGKIFKTNNTLRQIRMPNILKTVVALQLIFMNLNTLAQFNTDRVVSMGTGLGKNILGGMKDKKKQKNIQASLTELEIDGNNVTVLRVAEDKIISEGKAHIIRIQYLLADYNQQYNLKEHIDIPPYNDEINTLKSIDQDWPAHYYEKELSLYKKYEQELVKKEKAFKDSVEVTVRLEQKRREDSLAFVKKVEAENLAIAKKHQSDSLAYLKRIEGFHFIAVEVALFKEKPSEKSSTMGKLYQGTYVEVLSFEEKTPYVKIDFQGMEGYVNQEALVESLDEIVTSAADLATFKSREYYKYEANQAYTDQKVKELVAEEARQERAAMKQSNAAPRTSPGTKYHLGPKGGCYYIASGGSKVYVDRSRCH